MNKLFFLLSIISGLLVGSPTVFALEKTWLDHTISTYHKNQPIKAMLYGLWVDGKEVSVGAVGESMVHIPATDEMHFRVGGVAETMMSTVLMQLVERQQLQLDETIDTWFPHLPNAEQVTLKMLANSSSGYPDYVSNKQFLELVTSKPFKHWYADKLLDFAFSQTLLFAPGKSQSYSHTNYVLLGEILQKVTNQPLEQLYQSLIFEKLAMQNTRFALDSGIPSPVLHAFSQDRGVYEDATFWNPSWTAGSGAMTSTIKDLGKWGNAFLDSRLLKNTSTQQLRAKDTVGLGKNTETLYFSMGFGVINGWLVQNPRFGGYSGVFAVLPEKDIVFVAYNTLTESADNSTGNLSMQLWRMLAKDL